MWSPLSVLIGPPENTAEHAALVSKYGFAYRTLLGQTVMCLCYVSARYWLRHHYAI